MSMNLLTLIQFLQTLTAYLFVTMVLPCAFLGKQLSQYRFMDRVLFYFIIGNFYATNLVFLLQLLHISNFFTLWIGLLVVPAIIWVRLNQFPLLDKLRAFGHSARKLLTGSLSIKSAVDSLWRSVRGRCTAGLKKAGGNVRRNWLDWLLITALVLMVMWVYGTRMLQQFGYAAPDIPVHMYWVNGMSENNIFTDGIYPFGMHAVIYLVNELFGIDTYVIFRVFALVQCLAIHMMALLFLKLCCKSRYAAYTGVFLYTIGNYVHSGSYLATENLIRYLSALPQETSMIYILPTAYYAFRFFQEKSREVEEKLPEKASRMALTGLIISFSLCLAAHFYGAVIAALFCVGIALGHLRWLIKPVYFKRIIAAALISVTVALLPMGVAFVTGTPLSSSFYWGANVVTDYAWRGEKQAAESTAQPEDAQGAEDGAAASPTEEPVSSESSPGILETIVSFPVNLWEVSGKSIEGYTLRNAEIQWYSIVMRGMIIFLVAAGAVLLLNPERMYGALLLSTGAFMLLILVMFSASGLGIPELMERDRTNMFFAYMMIVVVGFTVDVCIWLATFLFKNRWPRDILSLAAVIAAAVCIWRQDMIRPPLVYAGLESNEAITCLTNIIATEPDSSWTVVSANDETQMVYGHGYHYEVITFLQEIETSGKDALAIPTEKVYFFIEKIPVYYWSLGNVQPVSREGAEEAVPQGNRLVVYQGTNRWIVMSHMYYWAQEFQRLYPNEMTVYLETDEFICYRLEQNPYRLYDLAIDYGYNSAKSEER